MELGLAVGDHPKHPEWEMAFDKRNEAERRYREATLMNDKAVEAYRLDFVKAQKAYNKVCDEL